MEDWFRPKKYLHFDYPIQEYQRSDYEKFVSNPESVAKHSFYPFITYTVTKYRTKEDPVTKKRYLDDSGIRNLSYAAHLDSQIYSYYSKRLSEIYEKRLEDYGISKNVIAFRKLKDLNGEAKSNIHLSKDAFEDIKRIGKCKVYAFDIKGFFDNLQAKHLKKSWQDILQVKSLPADHYAIYKTVTRHSVVDKDMLYARFNIPLKARLKDRKRICTPEEFREFVRGNGDSQIIGSSSVVRGMIRTVKAGIPQGSPISALLANIYMLDFDLKINSLVSGFGGVYFRYCDDLMLIIPMEAQLNAQSIVANALEGIGLWLNVDKTDISVFDVDNGSLICDKPIQYLGFVFDGKRVYMRTSSISKYLRKSKKAVYLAKMTMAKYNEVRRKKGILPHPLYKKKILRKYFHSGSKNFIRYACRAADVHGSVHIRRQIKKLTRYLEHIIDVPI